MIKQTDVQARLKLLRYGLLVVVIVTFIVAISYPIISLQDRSQLGNFLVRSLLYTAVVAVICAVLYFAYRWLLQRTMGQGGEGGEKKE